MVKNIRHSVPFERFLAVLAFRLSLAVIEVFLENDVKIALVTENHYIFDFPISIEMGKMSHTITPISPRDSIFSDVIA